ncbi:hypothetical protein OG689_30010 [Kitasatospora sp. NBC_00240]|uniref:hypothetical protein n=1 Tax=Kitasatospora sp. NBC_00240 TaxID=2903567 RepID=UPI002252542E|nr:hypothetical protein [Kitasatospora sp. NBC_00240]MCX5213453.1 hypothetical protein [Kitasatospora sp. NBC_00240]
MSSGSFRIEIQEVEAAARRIQAAVRELEPPAGTVGTAVGRVSRAAYGTDPLGVALLGDGRGADGLVGHQERALDGIRRYLRNSAAMAENLLLMCREYREADAGHAAELEGILRGAAPAPPAPIG